MIWLEGNSKINVPRKLHVVRRLSGKCVQRVNNTPILSLTKMYRELQDTHEFFDSELMIGNDERISVTFFRRSSRLSTRYETSLQR